MTDHNKNKRNSPDLAGDNNTEKHEDEGDDELQTKVENIKQDKNEKDDKNRDEYEGEKDNEQDEENKENVETKNNDEEAEKEDEDNDKCQADDDGQTEGEGQAEGKEQVEGEGEAEGEGEVDKKEEDDAPDFVQPVKSEEIEETPTQNESLMLSDEEQTRYRSIFDRTAVNERLDLKGFKVLFRLMGQVISSDEAEEMFDEGDKDDDNTIDFDEFCRLYSKFSQEEQTRKETIIASIEKLFPGFNDQDVELKKVEQLLLKLQRPDLDMKLVREKSDLCPDDIKSLVRSMDVYGSGFISKQEFVDTLCQHIDI